VEAPANWTSAVMSALSHPGREWTGACLLVAAAVIFTRAGYGPFGDTASRVRPCLNATRCPHNAALLAAGAGVLLVSGFRS
jgi:hypothetical protein